MTSNFGTETEVLLFLLKQCFLYSLPLYMLTLDTFFDKFQKNLEYYVDVFYGTSKGLILIYYF